MCPEAYQVGEQAIRALDAGGQLTPESEAGVDPPPLPDARFHQDAGLRSRIVRERILGAQEIHVARIARTHEVGAALLRSEEHTSELQSLRRLVCRLLLEK